MNKTETQIRKRYIKETGKHFKLIGDLETDEWDIPQWQYVEWLENQILEREKEGEGNEKD